MFVYKQEKLFSYVSSDVGTVRWVEPDDVSLSVGLGVGVVIYGWLVLDPLIESTCFKCFIVVWSCAVENFFHGRYFANSFPDVLWELCHAQWVYCGWSFGFPYGLYEASLRFKEMSKKFTSFRLHWIVILSPSCLKISIISFLMWSLV